MQPTQKDSFFGSADDLALIDLLTDIYSRRAHRPLQSPTPPQEEAQAPADETPLDHNN